MEGKVNFMGHAHELDWVRKLVASRLTELSAGAAEEPIETILVRDGCYCGRCFSVAEWRAVWFVEERIVKFFSESGGFQNSVRVVLEPHPDERAA